MRLRIISRRRRRERQMRRLRISMAELAAAFRRQDRPIRDRGRYAAEIDAARRAVRTYQMLLDLAWRSVRDAEHGQDWPVWTQELAVRRVTDAQARLRRAISAYVDAQVS